MDDRYPYIRFVVDAAQIIAGAVALVVLFSGALRACHHGGFGALIGLVVALVVAGVAFVAVMIQIETLRLLLDIEQSTRQAATASRPPPPAPSPPPGSTA